MIDQYIKRIMAELKTVELVTVEHDKTPSDAGLGLKDSLTKNSIDLWITTKAEHSKHSYNAAVNRALPIKL